VFFLFFSTCTVSAASVEELRGSVASAFFDVARAEKAGGDVSGLVAKLNSALELISAGGTQDLVRAESLVSEVKQAVVKVEGYGVQSTNMMYLTTGVTLVVLGALAVVIWVYGSRVFWGLWVRSRKDWVVERA
jgi:hypothetical protein